MSKGLLGISPKDANKCKSSRLILLVCHQPLQVRLHPVAIHDSQLA